MNDNERLGKLRIIESRESIAEFFSFWRRFYSGGDSLENLVDLATAKLPTSSEKEVILQRLIDWRDNGRDIPKEDMTQLEIMLRMSIPQKFESMDPLSTLGSTRMWNPDKEFDSWYMVHPDLLIANFMDGQKRAFGEIYGIPASGKTNIGCIIAQEWMKKGRTVISNISPLDGWSDKRYIHIKSLGQLIGNLIEQFLVGQVSLILLDEGGLYWLRAQAQRGTNIALDKFARIMGKWDGNIVVIEQRKESISSTIEDFSRLEYNALSPGVLWVRFPEGPKVTTMGKGIKGIPKSTIPYNPKDPSYLEPDVDIDAFLADINRADDAKGKAMRAIKFLNLHEPLWVKACRLVHEEGKTQKLVAEKLGVSPQAISQTLRKHPCQHT